MKLEFRIVSVADYDFLWSLHEEAYREHIEAIWGWDDVYQKAHFDHEFAERDADRVLIVVDDEIVGELQIEQRVDELFVRNIKIRGLSQGRGIGALVFESLKRRARQRGDAIVLWVFRTNKRAHAFYESLGFTQFASTETHHHLRWT